METKYKKFWKLIIGSIAVFFISVVLHNLLYAAHILTAHIPVLAFLTETLHILFFFIAIPLCPLVLIAGITGIIVLFFKKN